MLSSRSLPLVGRSPCQPVYDVTAAERIGTRTVQWTEETEQGLGLTHPEGMWVSLWRQPMPCSVQATSVPAVTLKRDRMDTPGWPPCCR